MSHAAQTVAPSGTTLSHLAPPPVGHCLNCHERLAGPHCHRCGQAASAPARITGHHLLHEIPHSIFHVDHGVFYTVREMLLRPGISIKRFLAGERKPFFSPLSLLLLVGGIGAFLFSKLHITLFPGHQPGVSPQVQRVQHEMMALVQKYQAWISILLLPISATVATPLLRRSTGYTWAEQLVAAALLSGAISAANLLFIPAMAYWSGKPAFQNVALAMTIVLIGYKTWGYAQLQAVTAEHTSVLSRWVRGFFVSICEYVGTIVLFAVVMVIIIFALH